MAGRHELGIDMRVGPVGIVNGTFGNRPPLHLPRFLPSGCKVNAKASPYVTHLPDAIAHGVEIRPQHAWWSASNLVLARATRSGVTYIREGDGIHRHQRAKAVAILWILD